MHCMVNKVLPIIRNRHQQITTMKNTHQWAYKYGNTDTVLVTIAGGLANNVS